ncbi:UdgX family uracil-DNA binding protein [Roseicella aerolata]|uniref:Type-4 uracil-DNA glycosylase n=1 Tax=Roseicella aerolata TaxID=2883479 RepID=A0A9X1IEX3_9PROT|nr:UdgX family uracil-DNA binding protein [Roseicella aerolata]MCB4823227.1 UdgX family uracil-DNA binding protein [Roseicella aerolata]
MSDGIGILLPGPADFGAWRQQARRLLAAEVPPEHVEWRVAGELPGLFGGGAPPPATAAPATASVPRAFLELAEIAIRHRGRERFALLYRLLWRLTHGENGLMQMATDPDVLRLHAMAKAVRRDAHKLHAFLRFRCVETDDGPRYVAWFEPEHHILEAETGFFLRRFAGLRWSILTPEASAHWDGESLRMGAGGTRAEAPPEDAHEELWRAYYRSIFNPARLKPAAMRAEMPVKYWKNLPEAREIPRLMAEAPRRVAEMVERGATPPAPRRQSSLHVPAQPIAASDVAEGMPADLFSQTEDRPAALAALKAELARRNDLPPWTGAATQMVFGEGPPGAPLLFVGEQPGDEEDIAGRPFVGPAGRLFDRAAVEAGIDRPATYVTNAVKHFKFKPTGRRRLHQSPDAGDIAYYRPFLKREIEIVAPQLVVSLGATALRALTGKPLAITKVRGELIETPDGLRVFPTVHPSYLLRLPDPESKEREYARFVADLKAAKREVS